MLYLLQEGLRRTINSYPDLRAEHQPKREGPSKAAKYLGSGRGKKETSLYFLSLQFSFLVMFDLMIDIT